MEDYKQKYEKALERARQVHTTNVDENKKSTEYIFPELKESEDERIRKVFRGWIYTQPLSFFDNGISKEKMLAWLEKQVEESKRLYVRFGEIPEDECSGVYHAGELVGKEEGVSVYDAKIDNHDNVLICISLPINENTLDTLQNLVEYDNRNCYLVKGTCVGKGSDNEPIIRNVSIVKRIDNYRIKESDKKSDQNLDNFCKTCKDDQKPTDKVEPKFKVDDWIVYNDNLYHIGNIALQRYYECLRVDGTVHTFSLDIDSKSHLWTIQDAKDGDVLAISSGSVCIFDNTVEDGIYPFAYCGLTNHGFEIYDRKLPFTHDRDIHPATKEQRDQLEKAMADAGYTFDFEKKELMKIEQKPAWSEEDEKRLKETLAFIETIEDLNKAKDGFKDVKIWLESLKERVKGE